MKVKILGSALANLEKGKQFYDGQELGPGDNFYEKLSPDIDTLAYYGGNHRKVFGFHHLLSKRFPHAISDAMDGPEIAVAYRVMSCRSDLKAHRRPFES